jgi:hypothetical protein
MSAGLDVDDGTARSLSAFDMVVLGIEPLDHRRPNVSGDLPTVFRAAPMFRRAPLGYDRFQVDTYVQWAEEELASAEREHEHLVARHLRTRADLEEARELLAHSSGGGEMLRLSRRIGSILAAAADEAESMRAEAESTKAEAEACRSAASAEAERMVAHAEVLIADAGAEAERMVATAVHEAEEMATEAGRILDRAERMSAEARAEAAARLEEVRAVEQRAVEHAGELRQQAVAEAAAARLQAREEIVRMLSTGREERRRADAAAAASSERLLRDTAARYAALLTEVQALEHRRAVLRAEVELLAEPVAAPTRRRLDVQLHRHLDRLGWRIRSLRAP